MDDSEWQSHLNLRQLHPKSRFRPKDIRSHPRFNVHQLGNRESNRCILYIEKEQPNNLITLFVYIKYAQYF